MNSSWKQLHPKDSFRVVVAQPITNVDEKYLSYLYQPIIGMDSFSLYHTLLTLVEDEQLDGVHHLHADLFNQLAIDLPRLFKARIRLEGIGLLKVFVKEQSEPRQFVYELSPPLPASKVFSDDVMSLLLLDSVGERRFNKLIKLFSKELSPPLGFQEVTKRFLDVYDFNQEQLISNQGELEIAKEAFPEREKRQLSSVDNSFDWVYFLQLLEGLYLDKEQVESELKETIFTLHQLYGINELEMKKLVEQEADYLTNRVEINSLRRHIIERYHGKKQAPEKKKQEPDIKLNSEDQQTRRFNTLKLQGFTEGDITVILSSEQIQPMIFLSAIKEQKGGFVSNDERWTVENLVKQSGLPDSVINVLIHFVLVGKENHTLNQKYVNSIANDWAQSKIFSPEAAIKKVQEMKIGQPKKTTSSYSNYGKGRGSKETLPDWVNREVKEETPVSAEEEAFFKEQLRLLREKGKEGDE